MRSTSKSRWSMFAAAASADRPPSESEAPARSPGTRLQFIHQLTANFTSWPAVLALSFSAPVRSGVEYVV